MARIVLPAGFTRHLMPGTRSAARGLARVAVLWRKFAPHAGAAYRPERHYMRGPGPKWHAQNSSPHQC
jgi:hypothetical protein